MEKVYFELGTFSKSCVNLRFDEKGMLKFYEELMGHLDALEDTMTAINNLTEDSVIEDHLEVLLVGEKIVQQPLDTLKEFSGTWTSTLVRCNRRVVQYVGSMTALQEMFLTHLESFIPFEEEDFETVKKLIKLSIGYLSYFIYYQYELDRVTNTGEYPFLISQYCHKNGMDIEDYAKEISDVCAANILRYRPRMSAFEMFPGVEEAFMRTAPDFAYDLDLVTVEMLTKYVRNEITLEEMEQIIDDEIQDSSQE